MPTVAPLKVCVCAVVVLQIEAEHLTSRNTLLERMRDLQEVVASPPLATAAPGLSAAQPQPAADKAQEQSTAVEAAPAQVAARSCALPQGAAARAGRPHASSAALIKAWGLHCCTHAMETLL